MAILANNYDPHLAGGQTTITTITTQIPEAQTHETPLPAAAT